MTVFEPFDQATCNAQERPTSEALDGGLASRPNGRTRPRHYMLAQFGPVTAVFFPARVEFAAKARDK